LRLSGSYFELTDRFAPRAGSNAGGPETTRSPVDGNEPDRKEPGGRRTADRKIVISVAKRLVPSAVRRNTVKRIVREAWRAAIRIDVPGELKRDTNDGTTGSAACPATEAGAQAGAEAPAVSNRVCLVRLKRYPGAVVKPKTKAHPRDTVGAPAPGFTAVRQRLRADADRLFATFLQGRAQEDSPGGASGAPAGRAQ